MSMTTLLVGLDRPEVGMLDDAAGRDSTLANRSRTCAMVARRMLTLLRHRRGAEPVARRLLLRSQPRLPALSGSSHVLR